MSSFSTFFLHCKQMVQKLVQFYCIIAQHCNYYYVVSSPVIMSYINAYVLRFQVCFSSGSDFCLFIVFCSPNPIALIIGCPILLIMFELHKEIHLDESSNRSCKFWSMFWMGPNWGKKQCRKMSTCF